jgi:tetratricopeptide (TPR) repeat protein
MDCDIEKEPLPFFLRQVYLKKLSGHLLVIAKDFHISLNLMDGMLANGMSTRFDEKLSVILHLMGQIDEEQYNFLSGLHQFSDDQVTGIILDNHFAKKKDIYYARIYQLRRIAISTFSLQRGQWIFTAGEPDPPLLEMFEIPLAGILVEGARAIDHASVYANKWQSCIPVLFNEIPMASEIYFTEPEREFYNVLQRQGRRSCQELIARLNMLPINFWRTILAFYLLGIIDFEKCEGLPDFSVETAALLELNRMLQESTGDIPGLLGLPPHATAADIEKVKTELIARFAPERFGSAAAPEIKDIARAVCRRLQEIAAALKVEAESSVEPELLSEAELVIEYESPAEPELLSEAEMVKEPPSSVEPELLSEVGMVLEPGSAAEPELLSEVELIREPEMPVRLNVAPEWDVEFELPAEAEPGLPDEPPAREFVPAAAPPALHLAEGAHEKAWDFLLKSKEMYERREFDKAVDLLKVAIKLEPGQGDFYYLLGLCQGEIEVMKHEAEINLKKAIELKSWSADPVYALGVLYRGMGKMKLAERCFQRVKEIAYEHTGASRALVDLRRQQPGKKDKVSFLKKKIF